MYPSGLPVGKGKAVKWSKGNLFQPTFWPALTPQLLDVDLIGVRVAEKTKIDIAVRVFRRFFVEGHTVVEKAPVLAVYIAFFDPVLSARALFVPLAEPYDGTRAQLTKA